MNKNNNIIKKTLLILLIVGLFILSSYNPQQKPNSWEYGPFDRLGTYVTMQVYARDEATSVMAKDYALYAIDRAAKIMNSYDPFSEMSIAVEAAKNGPTEISDELYFILSKSLEYSKLTRDAFDPTMPALIKLWKDAAENNTLPTEEMIADIRDNHTGYKHIKLTSPEQDKKATLSIDNPNIKLNINAIAKGYIADLSAKEMKHVPKVIAGMINIGGEIVCFNNSDTYSETEYMPVTPQPQGYEQTYPDDMPEDMPDDYVPEELPGDPYLRQQQTYSPETIKFKIGIQDPFVVDTPQAEQSYNWIVLLANKAVATSGNYRQYTTIDGQPYSHIIDPRTGYPANHNPSVTIIAPTCLDADALATALSVMTPQEGIELIETLADTEAMVISGTKADYQIHMSKGFEQYFAE